MAETVGERLQSARSMRSMSLAEVSSMTRIPVPALRALESNRFDDLPGQVFTRGFMKSYAECVGEDPAYIVRTYQSQCTHKPCSLEALSESQAKMGRAHSEKRRMYGAAVACAVLLVLFGVAFSIVMQPRHSDMTMELS